MARFQLEFVSISPVKNHVIRYKNRVISLVEFRLEKIKARDLIYLFWSSAIITGRFLPAAAVTKEFRGSAHLAATAFFA
jgi:hypothetical protein